MLEASGELLEEMTSSKMALIKEASGLTGNEIPMGR